MIRKYLRESWELTRSHLGAFSGATALLVVVSALTLSLMLPTLVAGLEGMYLRARQGKSVLPTDVFMHTRKFFPLLGASILIFLDVVLSVLTFFLIFGILLFIAIGRMPPLHEFTILMALGILWVLGAGVVICFREGRYLHALNFISELDDGAFESLRQSRSATKNRWSAATLAFLYFLVYGLLFSTQIPLLILGLFLFPLIVGATAMAFAHEVRDKVREVTGTQTVQAQGERSG